jgi:hypothetical protein
MASELQPIDISRMPELAQLAEEVHATRTPRVLRRGDQDLALLVPAGRSRPRATRTMLVDTSALPPVPDQTIDELVASRPGPVPRAFTDEEITAALEEDLADRWRAKSS